MADKRYRETTHDPFVRAHALATAGVLTASRWKSGPRPEEVLERALDESGGGYLRWRNPTVEHGVLPYTDHDLAKMWREATANARKAAVRLRVELDALSGPPPRHLLPADIAAVSRELMAPWMEAGAEAGQGAIGSLVFGVLPEEDLGLSGLAGGLDLESEYERFVLEANREGALVLPMKRLAIVGMPPSERQQIQLIRETVTRILPVPIALIDVPPPLVKVFDEILAVHADERLEDAVFRAHREVLSMTGSAPSTRLMPPLLIGNAPIEPTSLAPGSIARRSSRDKPPPAPPSDGLPPATSDAPAEQRRYTDVSVFNGSLFAEDLAEERRLEDSEPLVAGHAYTLEVAIRAKRLGIDRRTSAPREVLNPRRAEESATLYVRARSRSPLLTVEESVAKLAWPRDEDSTSALFRLQIGDQVVAQVATVEVRIYSSTLDLLDVVEARLALAPESGSPAAIAHQLAWPVPTDQAIEATSATESPRMLTIHVAREEGRYTFEYTFQKPDARPGQVIKFKALGSIQDSDLIALLKAVRDYWTSLAIRYFASKLDVTESTFQTMLQELAALGGRAWRLLFGTRHGDQAGAAEAIGDMLDGLVLEQDALVQITYEQNLVDFVFPWAILRPPSEGAVTIDGFWGARYRIEQVRRGPRRTGLEEDAIEVAFALDPRFGESSAECAMWERFKQRSNGKLNVAAPVSTRDDFVSHLVKEPAAHLFYFFCHGYAPGGEHQLDPDVLKALRDELDKMPENSEVRASFELYLALTTGRSDEALMYIGGAELKASFIAALEFFRRRRPVVFMNMCQSAALLPSMSSGLVRLFLDHEACAVIGTEGAMSSVFAHAFAEDILERLLGNQELGTALLQSRRRFLETRNPLGLAYTLYGRSTVRLGTSALVT